MSESPRENIGSPYRGGESLASQGNTMDDDLRKKFEYILYLNNGMGVPSDWKTMQLTPQTDEAS